jgi:hypothetical protein
MPIHRALQDGHRDAVWTAGSAGEGWWCQVSQQRAAGTTERGGPASGGRRGSKTGGVDGGRSERAQGDDHALGGRSIQFLGERISLGVKGDSQIPA